MADTPKPSGPPSVDAAQLCNLIGISDRELRDHAGRGVIVRVGRGRYDFAASIRGYCKHLRELASGHRSSSGLDNQSENALFTRERRRKLAHDAEVEAGNFIPVALVEQVMVDHIKGVKGMILGIANEAQAEMPSLTAFDLDVLRKICEKVLRDNAFRVIEDTKMHPEVQEYIDIKKGRKPI